MVFRHLLHDESQAGRVRAPRHSASISLGQEQHVVHNPCQAVQFFQIGGQHFMQIETGWTAQCQFIAGEQCGQWRTKLMGHISIESLQLGVGLIEPAQQSIELLHQRSQLSRLARTVQSLVKVVRRQGFHLTGQSAHGRKPDVDDRQTA